ncbi:MAG: hypothetical protein ACI9FJ_003258 [Alteromonadaceae bacterium]|jgi:hypothetical protein
MSNDSKVNKKTFFNENEQNNEKPFTLMILCFDSIYKASNQWDPNKRPP